MKFLLSMILFSVGVQAKSVDEILDSLDKLYRSKTSVGTVAMTVQTPNWTRTMEMDMWTKDLDYTFITIKSPRKDKGVSTLKRKNQMWNFFPKINKVIKIPPSMMMGAWMGSDFTNDDLVKESTFLNDYTNELVKNGDENVHLIRLRPKKSTVSIWDQIDLYIDKKTELPLKQEYFDERGEKVRVMTFTNVKKFDDKTIPATMTLTPLNKSGHKTVMEYKSIKFNVPVKDSIFTRANLQKRR